MLKSVWSPCCHMLGVVGSSLNVVKFEPTTPNMSQHIVTGWPNMCNILGPTMFATCCIKMLPLIGEGLYCKSHKCANVLSS